MNEKTNEQTDKQTNRRTSLSRLMNRSVKTNFHLVQIQIPLCSHQVRAHVTLFCRMADIVCNITGYRQFTVGLRRSVLVLVLTFQYQYCIVVDNNRWPAVMGMCPFWQPSFIHFCNILLTILFTVGAYITYRRVYTSIFLPHWNYYLPFGTRKQIPGDIPPRDNHRRVQQHS